MTDPRHPLFGKRFPLVSLPRLPGSHLVTVAYLDTVHLRIPVQATQLANCTPEHALTKLTKESILEVVALSEKHPAFSQPQHKQKKQKKSNPVKKPQGDKTERKHHGDL